MTMHMEALLQTLGAGLKKMFMEDMHRIATGWDSQGVLPPHPLATDLSKKASKQLALHFPVRARQKLGWRHFICRNSH
jgi:hypothetical protein